METAKKPHEGLQPVVHTVTNACHLLSISRCALYLLTSQGKLRLVKVAGRTLVTASEIARLISGDAHG